MRAGGVLENFMVVRTFFLYRIVAILGRTILRKFNEYTLIIYLTLKLLIIFTFLVNDQLVNNKFEIIP